jgi:hypothetical protein
VTLTAVVLLVALGALRELSGHGELLSRPVASAAGGLVLPATSAGAFILLGLTVAVAVARANRRGEPPSPT